MDETSCPFQRNESSAPPAIQDSRPTIFDPGDHCTIPVLAKPLTPPRELVERIFLFLDAIYVLRCRLVNREFNDIIQSSTLLQYLLACKAAGVVDNPRSQLSYAERLHLLKQRENAWIKLDPVFETTIKVNYQPSFVSSITSGTYLLGDNNQKDLHYCYFPSSPQDVPQWIRIPSHGPGQWWSGTLNRMGVAVHEHDLIVTVICSEVTNQADIQRHSLDLVLLKFSTGEYHPLARNPRIHIQRSHSADPWTSVRIVGDNLALVLKGGIFPDKLFVFDWKTGHKRLQHEGIENAYSSPVFISPELLLVPNIVLFHFEIWHLPPFHQNSKLPSQILSLKMPAVSPGSSIVSLVCHGELSPFLHSFPYYSPRPFFASLENSIISATLRISGFPSISYTLIIHRNALLDIIREWTSPSRIEQRDPSTWLMNQVTVQKITDLDDESVRLLDVHSTLVSIMPHPRSSSPTHSSTTASISPAPLELGSSSIPSDSSTPSSTHQYDFLQVQWADWGPPISRWFRSTDPQSQYITTLTGQRCAFLSPNPRNMTKSIVTVLDFNPYNVRRHKQKITREADSEDINGNEEKGEELETLMHNGTFSEEVYMGLKCVIYHAPAEYDFDVVLMDEDRLLGFKVDRSYRPKSVKVLYFG